MQFLKAFNKQPFPYWCYILAGIFTVYAVVTKPCRHELEAGLFLAVVITLIAAGSAIMRCVRWRHEVVHREVPEDDRNLF